MVTRRRSTAVRKTKPAVSSRPKNVVVACQGGGSHTAFTAGVLKCFLQHWPDEYRWTGLSGTSGGAICAAMVWYSLLKKDPAKGVALLEGFWAENSAHDFFDRLANDWLVLAGRLSQSVSLPTTSSPLVGAFAQEHLLALIEQHIPFAEVKKLWGADSPTLLVAAVDVLSGRFEIFENRDVTAQALLASAAVPEFFPAAQVSRADGLHYYWDGLFSQNPPINDFVKGKDKSLADKPDEIWVIQINPERRTHLPDTGKEIVDRRNELSGNLSLNQEISFIESVNQWLEWLPKDRFKPITVRRLALPGELGLDYSSKLDRRPEFIQELMTVGVESAQRFLKNLPEGNLW